MYISCALAAGDCLPFHKLTVIDQIYSNIDNILWTENLSKTSFLENGFQYYVEAASLLLWFWIYFLFVLKT